MYLHKISGNGILKSNYMKQQILSAEGSVSNTRYVIMFWNTTWTAAPHSLSFNHEGEFSSPKTSGKGDGTPHQYSCLENPMDRGAW